MEVTHLPARLLWFTGGCGGYCQVTAETFAPRRQRGGLGYQSRPQAKPLSQAIKGVGSEKRMFCRPANVARQ